MLELLRVKNVTDVCNNLQHSHAEIQKGPQEAVAFVGVQSIKGTTLFFGRRVSIEAIL